MKSRNGHTLVEILIVVVILGVLAAIVIPQFEEASTEAKTSSLCTDLQVMRSLIELYKIQHDDNLPGSGTASFTQALTSGTDSTGAVGTYYGPYLQKIPTNPFNELNTVRFESSISYGSAATRGWVFNTDTGFFRADSVGHADL